MRGAAALALLLSAGAIAQPAPAVLDPVTVTGSREPHASAQLPFAISTIDAAGIERAGPQLSLAEALARIPGLAALPRNNYAQDVQLQVRGFGARASFGVRGLRLYSDGIPATAPDGQGQVSHFALGSADRIEILRGPFSALYGASSGGVIALYHEAPQQNFAQLTADAGSFGLNQQRLDLGGTLGEHGGASAELGRFEIDGFRPHSAAQRRLGQARGEWRGGDSRLVLTANYWDQPAQDPLGLTRAQFEADPRQTTPQAGQFDTRKDAQQSQAGLQWSRRYTSAAFRALEVAAWGGRRAVTQWQAIPVAAQADPRHPGGVVDLDRVSTGLDLRSTMQLGAVELAGGVEAQRQNEQRRGYENFRSGGAELGVTGALRRDEDNVAASFDQYLQGLWSLTPALSASVGARHGELRVRSEDRYLSNGDDSGSRRFEFVNPVAGLLFRASDALSLYASAGRGYETPTLNELAYRADGSAGVNTELRAQKSYQYEAGMKLRAGAQRLDFTLFRADTDSELTPRSNSGGRATFQNAGAGRRDGAEAEYALRGERWQALAALTWIDARYREGFLTCGPPPCATPRVPVAAGNRLPGVAPVSGYAELAALWPALELAAEWRGADRRAVNDVNSDFAAGYGLLALRAVARWVTPRWRLRLGLRGDNLLGQVYSPSLIVNEGNGRYFEPGAPRSVLLSLRGEWIP